MKPSCRPHSSSKHWTGPAADDLHWPASRLKLLPRPTAPCLHSTALCDYLKYAKHAETSHGSQCTARPTPSRRAHTTAREIFTGLCCHGRREPVRRRVHARDVHNEDADLQHVRQQVEHVHQAEPPPAICCLPCGGRGGAYGRQCMQGQLSTNRNTPATKLAAWKTASSQNMHACLRA